MKRIMVNGMHFIDEDGYQVLMNGICFICRDKSKGYLESDIEQLMAHYAKRGFNLIRLGIFWDGVEPEPGVYDEHYLNRIKRVVECAEELRIYVFLDMHQDLFSVKFIDGAPAWATLDEGLPHPGDLSLWYDAYLKSPAVIKAADNFWANAPALDGVGLLDHYERMWEHIADRFKGHANMIGLEPMNEPYMGSIAPQTFQAAVEAVRRINPSFDLNDPLTVSPEASECMFTIMTERFAWFDRETLMPFYNRILKAIRKAGNIPLVTGGNIYASVVKTGISRITDELGNPDTQQIYAPHGYDSVVDTDNYHLYSKENVSRIFAQKRESQLELNLPVIVGEWGNFPSGNYTNGLIEHMTGILERYLWSSTYHQYCLGMEKDPNYASLERGYPMRIAGSLQSYHYDYQKRKFAICWEAEAGGAVVVYFPDVTNIAPKDIVLTGAAKVSVEGFEGAQGGLIVIIPHINGIMEAEIQ